MLRDNLSKTLNKVQYNIFIERNYSLKRVAINLLIIFLTLAISIKAFDWIFALSFEMHPSKLTRGESRALIIREWDPDQSIVLYPRPSDLRFSDSLENKPYRFSIDKNGFVKNANESEERNIEEELKIIFFGGSTTEVMYAEEQNRFPSRVEHLLSEKFDHSVKVLNAGVAGNDSMHSLINLIAKGLKEDPDIVVMMHNINDMALLAHTGDYWNVPAENSKIISLDNSTSSSGLIKIARVIKNLLLPNLYPYLKDRLFPSINFHSNPLEGFNNEEIHDTDILNEFKKSVQSFLAICKVWGIKPILMTQFNRINENDPIFQKWADEKLVPYKLTKKEFVELYANFNQALREIAKQNEVTLIDLDKLVPSDSSHLYDIVHLTDKGSALAANIIAETVTIQQKEK